MPKTHPALKGLQAAGATGGNQTDAGYPFPGAGTAGTLIVSPSVSAPAAPLPAPPLAQKPANHSTPPAKHAKSDGKGDGKVIVHEHTRGKPFPKKA